MDNVIKLADLPQFQHDENQQIVKLDTDDLPMKEIVNLPQFQHDENQQIVHLNADDLSVRETVINTADHGEILQPEVNTQQEPDERLIAHEMTDEEKAIPNVKDLNEISRCYLNNMLKPYEDALAPATEVDQINLWIPQIFQEKDLKNVQKAIHGKVDIEDIKQAIVNFISGHLLSIIKVEPKMITPWDLAGTRDALTTKLFGPGNSEIPIEVTVGPTTYIHFLSEEFTFGLLNILDTNPSYLITVGGTKIKSDDIKRNYDPVNATEFKYEITTPLGLTRFYTPDFIQGIMTAAQWLNINAHTLVKDFKGIMNDTLIPLTF